MKPPVLALRRAVYGTLINCLRFLIRPRHRLRYRLTVLKLDRFGDAVLSIGAVRRLIDGFGEKKTLLIVSKIAEPVYRKQFPQAMILALPAFCERLWPDLAMCLIRNARRLRAVSTDTLVCLRHQHSDYLHAVAHLVHVERSHAVRWQHSSERTSLSFPNCQFAPYPHAVERGCLELEAHRRVVASAIGTEIALDEMFPTLTSWASPGGCGLLLCPEAGDPIREYPLQLWAEAICRFLKYKPDVNVSVCLPRGSRYEPLMPSFNEAVAGRIRLIITSTFEAFVTAIANADVVLAPESGPAHLATAMGKPGVFLLGGGHFGMFAPWSKNGKQIWLQHQLSCYRCQWKCSRPEPCCITEIQPDDVVRALVAVMNVGPFEALPTSSPVQDGPARACD